MIRLIVAFVLISSAGFASPAPESLANPVQEAHARVLQKEFRCLVCQGESIDESGAPLAADLRRLIREHIARGETDAQIRQYLVARYGKFILMNPPVEPDTYGLWFAPLAVLVLGGLSAALIVSRARKRAAPEDDIVAPL